MTGKSASSIFALITVAASRLLHKNSYTMIKRWAFLSCVLSHEMACTCSHAVGLVLEMGAIPVTSQAIHTGHRGWDYQLNQKATHHSCCALPCTVTCLIATKPPDSSLYQTLATDISQQQTKQKKLQCFSVINNTMTPLMEGHATMNGYCTTFSDNQLDN